MERIKHVQDQVLKADPKKKMCTARPGWQTMNVSQALYKDNLNAINLQELRDIVEVDTKKGIVRCEPNVTCAQITACLKPLGYTLKIVPELDDLTIGGLAAGSGIESASHKYGLFQDICVGFEVVLADGTLTFCSKDQNKDLFDSLPWSYGTLGFLVSIDVEIIPAKKYVKLRYIPCKSMKECKQLLEKECGKGHEFIEALAYDSQRSVVMLGDMTDEYEFSKLNSIGYFWKEWFYKHVEHYADSGIEGEEYIPLRQYYHRHSKSIFWEMEEILPFGNNFWFRIFFGWLVPPKISFLKLTTTADLHKVYKTHHVVQDMLVPLSVFEESMEFFHKQWQVYPLWVCPTLMPKSSKGFVKNVTDDLQFVDIGAYGTPKAKGYEAVQSHRNVEKYVRDVKGFQLLYADTYMDEEEFREMFDHSIYDEQRKKLKCEKSFPTVFEKVCRSARN